MSERMNMLDRHNLVDKDF